MSEPANVSSELSSPASAPPGTASQPSKRYSSEIRDEQARRTRRAIVAAAHDLFLAQG